MIKPRIGITAGLDSPRWLPGGSSWEPYALAITAAGGEPVHLDGATRGREAEVLSGLQGLLFSGGKDVHLNSYPNRPDTGAEPVDEFMHRFRMHPEPLRDDYELPLLDAALERDFPVLGICRGCQVLNVALGGRLVLDIELQADTELQHTSKDGPEALSSFHTVRILPGSRIAEILGSNGEPWPCNSRHHQSVLAQESMSAQVAAVSPTDGIVEAIEVPGRRWALAVQWHPERDSDEEVRELYAPLFRSFLEAAS